MDGMKYGYGASAERQTAALHLASLKRALSSLLIVAAAPTANRSSVQAGQPKNNPRLAGKTDCATDTVLCFIS
jgi:hypothetical protein